MVSGLVDIIQHAKVRNMYTLFACRSSLYIYVMFNQAQHDCIVWEKHGLVISVLHSALGGPRLRAGNCNEELGAKLC